MKIATSNFYEVMDKKLQNLIKLNIIQKFFDVNGINQERNRIRIQNFLQHLQLSSQNRCQNPIKAISNKNVKQPDKRDVNSCGNRQGGKGADGHLSLLILSNQTAFRDTLSSENTPCQLGVDVWNWEQARQWPPFPPDLCTLGICAKRAVLSGIFEFVLGVGNFRERVTEKRINQGKLSLCAFSQIFSF